MPTNEGEKLDRAAILAPDASKMEERIEVAESAMHARLDELSLNHGGRLEEYRAIADALNRLSIYGATLPDVRRYCRVTRFLSNPNRWCFEWQQGGASVSYARH